MKKLLFSFVVLCFISCFHIQARGGLEKNKVAVFDFTVQNENVGSGHLGILTAELFVANLVGDGRFDLVERNRLQKILQEQVLVQSGVIDDSTAVKTGRLVGVNTILLGTTVMVGEGPAVEVSARAIDVQSGSILAAEFGRSGNLEPLHQLVSRLSRGLIRNLLNRAPVGEATEYNTAQPGGNTLVPVRGLIGTEKMAIFQDPETQRLFREGGFAVRVTGVGSRQMLREVNPAAYDFVIPTGASVAEKISKDYKLYGTRDLFYTPLVVASWKPIAELFAENGIAERVGDIWYLHMGKIIDLVNQGTSWADLQNNSVYKTNKPIIITSTDPRTSSSAALYLSIASYVANGEAIISSKEEINEVLPKIRTLFSRQGGQAFSSLGPFEDYLTMGMGKSPLVTAYEAQFIEAAAADMVTEEMVLFYPLPTIYAKGVFIPMTTVGRRVLDLINTDDQFRRMITEHGLHPKKGRYFSEYVTKIGVAVPKTLFDVINSPVDELQEEMIRQIFE